MEKRKFDVWDVVSFQEYPEGAVLETNDANLRLKVYKRTAIDYDVVEEAEIGPITEIFYDESGKLRSQREIIDDVISIALYIENMESDFDEILVDETVAELYENLDPWF